MLSLFAGGVIGLELGSVYRRLGSEIIVVEFLDRVTPGLDSEVSTAFQKLLAKQGFTFRLGTKVTGATIDNGRASVAVECVKTGNKDTIECDKILLAVGRRPFTEGLGIEALGISTEKVRCSVVSNGVGNVLMMTLNVVRRVLFKKLLSMQ